MQSASNPLELMARRLEIHAPLMPDDRAALLALPFTTRTVRPSYYLVREGDAPSQCAVLVSGYAFRQKLTATGTRQIVSLHIPGEALDLQHLFLDVADHNVQTLTHADVAIIPRDALRELVSARASIGHAVLVYMLAEASIFREWILNIGRRDARGRIAHLLCEFAIRLDAQGLSGKEGYDLLMTQEQLADAVGLTSVHVNRTLKSLAADGLIVRDQHHLRFPHWQALRDVAGFNERYLHLQMQAA